jgi:hypothetical protein
MVSISPVPKLDPGPVSYFQLPDGALPAVPLKSSLKVVVQPAGGAGTALGDAVARAAAAAETGWPAGRAIDGAAGVDAATAAGTPASTSTGAAAAVSTSNHRRPGRASRLNRCKTPRSGRNE